MTAVFLQGNSRDVLKGIPPDFFHVCVTSPPYFGLRQYQGGSEVWDGVKSGGCKHEWGAEMIRRDRGTAKGRSAVVGNQLREVSGIQTVQGNFCQLCGAWKGALGNEPTPALYLSHLVEICREVRRVLRPDGVCFINVGDSWAGGRVQSGGASPEGQGERHKSGESLNRSVDQLTSPKTTRALDDRKTLRESGIKPLDMVLIPEQLALALRADGWWLRSILIWAKGVSLSESYNGNPMPESVNGWRWEQHKVKVKSRGKSEAGIDKYEQMGSGNPHATRDGYESEWQDCSGCPKCEKNGGYVLHKGSWRPTDSFEYVLMLTKTSSYYCDRESVLERGVYPAGEHRDGGNGHKSLGAGSRTTEGLHNKDWSGNGGRNLRSVLDVPVDLNDAVLRIPTAGSKVKHFATFPPRLIEPLIKAATSEKGCCPKCSSPWARVIDRGFAAHDGMTATAYSEGSNANRLALLRQGSRGNGREYVNATSTIGWLSTCQCGIQETEPCRVLDPFSGAGTTALVAERLGLDSIGIDTSAEYIQLSKSRLAEDEQKRIDEFIKQAKQSARKQCARKSNTCSIDIYNLQV